MDIRLPLPAALRHRVQTDENLWAHAVSLIVSPPVVWTLWVFAVTLPTATDRGTTLLFGTLFALAVCFGPMFFIAYMVRIGKIGDLHMRLSRERYVPYSMAIIGGIVCEFVYWRFDAEPILHLVTLVSIVQLTIMLIGTFFVHLSLHAMAMSSIISATTLMFGFRQAVLFLPVLLLVVLARLVLRRHTPAQVFIGTLVGIISPLLVVVALAALI